MGACSNPIHLFQLRFFRFYLAEHIKTKETLKTTKKVGDQWAEIARSLVFASLTRANLEKTMVRSIWLLDKEIILSADYITFTTKAAVLLHDYELRVGNYSSAFIITGLTVRLAQCLQLNVELGNETASPRFSPAVNESRRRLMWSVYIMDCWVGSGVDELTLLSDADISINLPCGENNFILERIEVTAQSIPFNENFGLHAENLDIAAQFVRLMSIRKRALRLPSATRFSSVFVLTQGL